MNFTDEDVCELLQILDANQYEELQVETDKMKLTLRRGGDGEWTQSIQSLQVPNIENPVRTAPTDDAAPKTVSEEDVDTGGMTAIRTPLLGTFYRASSPGSAPFVKVGDVVQEETVIGIVETMKLMNSVYAGERGKIVEICREDAEFVEQDGILMLLAPEDSP